MLEVVQNTQDFLQEVNHIHRFIPYHNHQFRDKIPDPETEFKEFERRFKYVWANLEILKFWATLVRKNQSEDRIPS